MSMSLEKLSQNLEMEITSSKGGLATVKDANGKMKLSYIDSETEDFFMVNGKPIIISNIASDGNSAKLIFNDDLYFGSMQPRFDDGDLVDIIYENGRPKIVNDSNGNNLLMFIHSDYSNRIILGNNRCNYELLYPLQNIEGAFYTSKENEDFSIGIDINTGNKSIFIKKGEESIKMDLSNIGIENSFVDCAHPDIEYFSELELPNKESMFILSGRIVAFNEEKEELYKVDIGVEYKSAQWLHGEILLEKINNDKIKISPSLEDPKKPETICLNDNTLFLTSDPVDEINEGGEFYPRYFLQIGNQQELINKDEIIYINGVEFYKFGHNKRSDEKGVYTDGLNIYMLENDENGNLKFLNFEGEEYPFQIINNYVNGLTKNYKSLVYVNGSERRTIPVILDQNHEHESEGEENIREEYKELKLTEEQKELRMVWVNDEHGIVCLASDKSNTSQYKFYRLNNDGSITYVFSNNYKINFIDEGKSVRVSVDNYGRDSEYFTLVRKPNSTSVLEATEINGKENLLVETKEGIRSIVAKEDGHGFKFVNFNVDIDPETLLPVDASSFEFDSDIFYMDNNGAVEIGGNNYQLCNINGEETTDYKDSIIEIGGKKVLLLVNRNTGTDNLYGYFEGISNNLCWQKIKFSESNDNGSFEFSSLNNNIETVSLGGESFILRSYNTSSRVLQIIEVTDEGIVERFINRKSVKRGTSDDNNYSGEEFLCDGKVVHIQKIKSYRFVEGNDGQQYFRDYYLNELQRIDLPNNVELGSIPFCDPSNYNSKLGLSIDRAILETVEIDGKTLYITEIEEKEYLIDGERKKVKTFFNNDTNQLESYERKGEEYTRMELGGSDKLIFAEDSQIYFADLSNNRPYIPVPKEGLFNSEVLNMGKSCLLIDNRNGKKFQIGIDCVSGEFGVYAVKQIKDKYYSILASQEGCNIELEENGVSVGDVQYSEELMDLLYDKLTKDIKEKIFSRVKSFIISNVSDVIKK